jgi:hypothetical protein
MRVGALVVCVDDAFPDWARRIYRQLPVKDEVYTIREVSLGRGVLATKKGTPPGSETHPDVRVLLQELTNDIDPLCSHAQELGFKAERFRELETGVEESVEVNSEVLAPAIPAGVEG